MQEPAVHVSEGADWTERGDTSVWGAAFHDGHLYRGRELARLFAECSTSKAFRSVVASLNGAFAAVVRSGPDVFAAVDRWRSRPLFYSADGERVYLSDDPGWLRKARGDDAVDPASAAEYARSTFVSGSNTLAPTVSQLQSGELLVGSATGASGPDVETVRYYRFADQQSRDWDEGETLDRYNAVLEGVFDRLVEYADGRPVALSLSAGFDSRLVAVELTERDYPVYAFAYTRNGEADVAAEVAAELGIEFQRIPLSHGEIAEWYDSAERRAFDDAVGVEDAVPNYWLPVVMQKLDRGDVVPSDAVVVTGDGAHGMASHLPPEFVDTETVTRSAFADAILETGYPNLSVGSEHEDAVRRRALAAVESALYTYGEVEPASDAVPAFEEWNWQERQSKVIRSNYVYEYYGYDCWFPLKDHAYMDFWRDAPPRHRQRKSFHRTYVERRYADATGRETVGATFEPMSDWLYYLNKTVGELPGVGTAARGLYNYLFDEDVEYRPIYGMVSEREFERIVTDLPLDRAAARSLTPRHLHGLHLLGEYRFADH